MSETFTLTIEQPEANIWPLVSAPVLLFCASLILLAVALIVGLIAAAMHREPAIKIAATLMGTAGVICAVVSFAWYNNEYANIQATWDVQIARQQEAALTHRGLNDVHVTWFMGADDHMQYDFTAHRDSEPITGFLIPTSQNNVFEVYMYLTNHPPHPPTNPATTPA